MLIVRKRTLLILILIAGLIALKPSLLISAKNTITECLLFPAKMLKSLNQSIKTKKHYIEENFRLKEKSALLALELKRNSSIILENERLRELLAYKNRYQFKGVAAEVISRVPSTWNNAIIINKGSDYGVKRDSAVCTKEGMIGRVVEVMPMTSKVMLITDQNSRVGVILEESRQTGILIGSAKGGCEVIYLNIDSDVNIGENVFTSGLGGLFPKEVYVGKVADIKPDATGIYKLAVIKTGQDMNKLENIICIE